MPTTYAIIKGNQYMDATLYTGNGGTQSIVNAGGFSPDLVWIKNRSNALSHCITDAVRGTNLQLASNSTGGDQSTTDGVTSFNSNGFSLGAGTQQYSSNTNSQTYVGWQWRASDSAPVTNTNGSITSTVSANTTSGFSVVTYTGTGASSATIGHGLSAVPKMIIVKSRSNAIKWGVYHVSLGNTKMAYLNETSVPGTSSVYWNDTTPSSSVFTIGNGDEVGINGATYVAYCWSEVPGFSKFGSYTGNGSSDGPFVYCGFEPKFLMTKNSDNAVQGWTMQNPANLGYNVVDIMFLRNHQRHKMQLMLR